MSDFLNLLKNTVIEKAATAVTFSVKSYKQYPFPTVLLEKVKEFFTMSILCDIVITKIIDINSIIMDTPYCNRYMQSGNPYVSTPYSENFAIYGTCYDVNSKRKDIRFKAYLFSILFFGIVEKEELLKQLGKIDINNVSMLSYNLINEMLSESTLFETETHFIGLNVVVSALNENKKSEVKKTK